MVCPRILSQRRRLVAGLFLCLACQLGPALAAAPGADEIFNFAAGLYTAGDWDRAATEYERFLFLHPNDPRASEAKLFLGRCYRSLGMMTRAYAIFEALYRSRSAAEEPKRQALEEMITTRRQQGRLQAAAQLAQAYLRHHGSDPRADGVRYLLAWLYIDAGAYRAASNTLSTIENEGDLGTRAQALRLHLQQQPYQPPKSARTAAILSAVFPGAGQLYAGEPAKAAASFLLNGLFIAGAVAAFSHDSPVLGTMLSIFEFGWYQGGITSAAEGAERVNTAAEDLYRQQLKQRYRLSLGLTAGSGTLGLQVVLAY